MLQARATEVVDNDGSHYGLSRTGNAPAPDGLGRVRLPPLKLVGLEQPGAGALLDTVGDGLVGLVHLQRGEPVEDGGLELLIGRLLLHLAEALDHGVLVVGEESVDVLLQAGDALEDGVDVAATEGQLGGGASGLKARLRLQFICKRRRSVSARMRRYLRKVRAPVVVSTWEHSTSAISLKNSA